MLKPMAENWLGMSRLLKAAILYIWSSLYPAFESLARTECGQRDAVPGEAEHMLAVGGAASPGIIAENARVNGR